MKYIFDLDGTIVFDGKSIPNVIIKALKAIEKNKHEVIFASARPIRDMLPILQEHFDGNLLIGGNGSIASYKGEIEIIKAIPANVFKIIKEIIIQYDLDYLVDSDWNYALHNRNDSVANINAKVDALNLASNVALDTIKECIKCNVMNIPIALYDQIYDLIAELPISIVKHADNYSIDITAMNINKYTTISKYINAEDYIAFGNDDNDLELLSHAFLSIGVGDNPNIQEVANVLIKSNEVNISKFINHYQKLCF